MRDKRLIRQTDSLSQLEPGVSADEQARLLNDPPLSFRKSEHGAPVENN